MQEVSSFSLYYKPNVFHVAWMPNSIVLKAAKIYFVILSCYIVGICINEMTFKFHTVIGALFVWDTISSYKRFLPVRK